MPSFGFGVSISRVKDGDERDGDYGWAGQYGTFFTVSPEEELIIVFLCQKLPFEQPIYDAVRPRIFNAIAEIRQGILD
jgi:CubicO group peptidase (beta-lactamase class C family)